jgi:hypothetical protein
MTNLPVVGNIVPQFLLPLQQPFQQALPPGMSPMNSIGGGVSGIGTINWAVQPPVNTLQTVGLYNPQFTPLKPLEEGPMQVGELVAWRIWQINGSYLSSYSADTSWYPNEPMTGDPHDYDHQGVWCLKSPHDALHMALHSNGTYALGTVWLWGTVIEHSRGYRGEFAMIRSIDTIVGKSNHQELEILRKTYGVTDSNNAQKIGEVTNEEG